MSNLKIQKIIFGKPKFYHFVTFTAGEHEIPIVEDRHGIEIEVMIPVATRLEDIEKIALDKAKRFIKELAAAL